MKPRTPHQRREYVQVLIAAGHSPRFAQWVSRSCYDPEHPAAAEAYRLWCAYHPHARRLMGDWLTEDSLWQVAS